MVLAFNQLRASGLLNPGVIQALTAGSPLVTETPIYVTNVSGEVIPPFACMQCTGTEEIGDQNFTLVNKPADATGAAGGFLFNGPTEIPIYEEGIAQKGPVVRMLTNGAAITAGAKWKPTASAWTVAPSGTLFQAIGADNIETNVMKAFASVPTPVAIIDLRLSGTELQYTTDGTTWTTWHNAAACP